MGLAQGDDGGHVRFPSEPVRVTVGPRNLRGNLNNTATIENYTGFKTVQGPELAQNMYDGATQFGATYGYGTVTALTVNEDGTKSVTTDMGDTFIAKAVVIATGSDQRKLGAPGEQEYSGRGVSYCAVCDGAFFRNKHLIVVGGGDSAVEEDVFNSVCRQGNRLGAPRPLEGPNGSPGTGEEEWTNGVHLQH